MGEKTFPFRVHFEDGSTWDTTAIDADTARKLAKPISERRETIVRKIKVIRENARG